MGCVVAFVRETIPKASRMKAFVLTDIPSPYQVELFNEISAQKTLDLSVAYLRNSDPARSWQPAAAAYDCRSVGESSASFTEAARLAAEADVAIFNYYNHPLAERLIQRRAETGRPWCFWGERPGFRRPRFASRLLRKWKLKTLRRSCAPIWGIGEFALQEYKHEFGAERLYRNVPYFSDLDRFKAARAERKERTRTERVFLFCGSFTMRKGVDLVARAFVRLAREVPQVRLVIAGEGVLKESIARTLQPVQNQVEFVGFKHWDELPELYAAADVLCVPSRYDGWGLVVPEGLAAGLPVIATDRMGAGLEFVRNGINGWLIAAGEEETVLAAMRAAAILTDTELAQAGHDAQRSVREHTLAHGAARFASYAREAANV
ncbi:MAG TPA: glycosyltransferase family 4 protein [Pyrinomonadaceae bacterium]|nr:glycosyltransferase family 4 protein [Pyrinomonadaceae bacterium]